MTKQAEQAFLSALSATANVALAAASVGVAEAAFYRRRTNNPAFAREMRFALKEGWERLRAVVLAGFQQDSHADDAWRMGQNDAPDLPAVTAVQALQLMYLHQKQATIGSVRFGRRRRAGESEDAHQAAIWADYRTLSAARSEDVIRNGLDALAARLGVSRHEPPAPALPDLAQVTPKKAKPARARHGEQALFGGWRIAQLRAAQRAAGAREEPSDD